MNVDRRARRCPIGITTYLSRSGLTDTVTTVLPLTGDASDRRYFRALQTQAPSIVFALHAEPFDADRLPFVRVAGLFEAMPLPVPRILDRAGDLGILVLEDLGDVTLQAHLGAAPAAEHSRLYRQAVSFIEIMQRRGAELASRDYPPYGIAFDVEKLLWELEFFTKHFLEAYRGAVISPADADGARRRNGAAIAAELAAEPRVLCHRDYHSRNLMLHGGELYIIDFQDARLGPDTYDLVSLLRDSYVDLPDASGRGADRVLHRAEAAAGHAAGRLAGVGARLPPALRRDGAAAQPEGARHVRLPDERPAEFRLHPVHPAHHSSRPEESRAVTPGSRRLRELLAPFITELR